MKTKILAILAGLAMLSPLASADLTLTRLKTLGAGGWRTGVSLPVYKIKQNSVTVLGLLDESAFEDAIQLKSLSGFETVYGGLGFHVPVLAVDEWLRRTAGLSNSSVSVDVGYTFKLNSFDSIRTLRDGHFGLGVSVNTKF